MSGEPSVQQEVLRRIWDSQSPHELWSIMRASAGARDLGLVKELENEASACEVVQPKVAHRLREMADAIRTIHDLLGEFAEIKDMAALLKWYQLSPVCFSSEFFPLVDSFLSDAEAANARLHLRSPLRRRSHWWRSLR